MPTISPSLDPVGRATENLERLVANAGQSFQGSIVLGLGFVMPSAEAHALIEKDPANAEVLFPYVNGEDLNTSPTQQGSRWIINFGERTEEEARQYPDCWAIVEELVRPERVTKDGRKYPRMVQEWWKHWNARPGMYAAVAGMVRVLVIARISKTVQPVFVPTGQVLNEKVVVFAYHDDFHFGVLSSSFHRLWAITHSSTLRTDIQYTPTDCFETFPQPPYDAAVEAAGRALDHHRGPLMVANDQGGSPRPTTGYTIRPTRAWASPSCAACTWSWTTPWPAPTGGTISTWTTGSGTPARGGASLSAPQPEPRCSTASWSSTTAATPRRWPPASTPKAQALR